MNTRFGTFIIAMAAVGLLGGASLATAGPGAQRNALKATQIENSGEVAPNDPIWESARPLYLPLIFINDPVWMNELKPSQREIYMDTEGDKGGRLEARAVFDATQIAIRLSWEDATENRVMNDTDDFPDGASVAFDARMMCHMGRMSDPQNIWNMWYWRADDDRSENLLSAGVGTTTKVPTANLRAESLWEDGHWYVVLTRPLGSSDPDTQVDLSKGNDAIRFARWDGGRNQRNGKKWITMSAHLELK